MGFTADAGALVPSWPALIGTIAGRLAPGAGAPIPLQQKRRDMTEVRNGDVVRIRYTAKTTDGAELDSSGRDPLELQVGAGQVISGLDRRIDGMTVGET